MSVLERVWEVLTNHTWVGTAHSYRLPGPPDSFSSAEVRVSKGKLVPLGAQEEALEELNKECRLECRKQMPAVMDELEHMIEEHSPR